MEEAMTTIYESRAILLYDETAPRHCQWLCQCAREDFAAQGKDPFEARNKLIKLIRDQYLIDTQQGRTPLLSTPPAPRWVYQTLIDCLMDTESAPNVIPILINVELQKVHP